jgi:hypothetical protein
LNQYTTIIGRGARGWDWAEENAKIGWRRLELKQAESALKLLPKVAEILSEEGGNAEEQMRRMRAMFMRGGGKLLAEKTD